MLIGIALEEKNTDKAIEIFKQLNQVYETETKPRIKILVTLSEALIQKSKTRMVDKAKAQETFHQLLKQNNLESSIRLIVLFNLCELLIDELESFKDPAILVEIKDILDQMTNLAQKQNSYILNCQVLIIKAQILVSEGDFDTALEYFKEARTIAEDKGLEILLNSISLQEKTMTETIKKWKTLLESEAPIAKKLEEIHLKSHLKDIRSYLYDANQIFREMGG